VKVSFLVKALIIGVFALLLSSYFVSQNQGVKSFDTSLLLTDFDANLVDGIKMQTAKNEELVNAQKVLMQWQLPNKFGYAADVTELSKLLQNLKNAHIVELKTKQQKYFDRLGLQDISNESSEATLLTLSSGAKSIELLLGKESSSANGRYIRFADQQQTYLVDLDIDIPDDDTSWLMPNIVSVEFDDIRQVDISMPDGDFSIVRKEIQNDDKASDAKDSADKNDEDSADIKALTEIDITEPLKSLGTVTLSDNFELARSSKKTLSKQASSKQKPIKDKTVQYESIFTGLVRNIINIKAKDVQLAEQNNMELYQSIVISYVDVLVSNESPQGYAAGTQGNGSSQLSQSGELSQMNQLTLTLYKNGSEQTDYWLQVDDQRWLLKISEFDFKQVSKPLDSYFE